MRLDAYINAVVADLKANATFLRDVGTHGKVFGLAELQTLTLLAPACRIALVGSRGGSAMLPRSASAGGAMGRANNGQFRGPLQMIAFLIEQDKGKEEARDRAIKLCDDFMYYMEHRTFGLSHNDAGPCLISGFEVLYSAEIDAQGAAIAAVTWEQEVFFGRDLHDEDMALITEPAMFPKPPRVDYTEREWYTKGDLDVAKPPRVRSDAITHFTDETIPEDAEDNEHKPMPPVEGE